MKTLFQYRANQRGKRARSIARGLGKLKRKLQRDLDQEYSWESESKNLALRISFALRETERYGRFVINFDLDKRQALLADKQLNI